MKQQLLENYRKHPKFRFDVPTLSLPTNLLERFARSYGDTRSPITKGQFREALSALSEIFHELRSQVEDDLMLDFLDELEHEIRQLMSADLPYRLRLQASSKGEHISGLAEELRINNHFFGAISAPVVDEILEVGANWLSKFRENARAGKLKRSDLSIDSGPAVSRICKILDKEFKRQGIFEEVSRFVGIDYRFTGCSLELSSAGSTWWRDAMGNESPPKTMYAHLDESIFAPKSIVYLSDVAGDNGPTTLFPAAYQEMDNNSLQDCVGRVIGKVGNRPGSRLAQHYNKSYHQSAGSPEFRKHFMMLPEAMRFNSHLGWEVMPGSELERSLAAREIEMLGPPGTFIVFDGSNLLHRGGLIEKGERVVLQVVFYPGTRWTHRLRLVGRLVSNLLNRTRTS